MLFWLCRKAYSQFSKIQTEIPKKKNQQDLEVNSKECETGTAVTIQLISKK